MVRSVLIQHFIYMVLPDELDHSYVCPGLLIFPVMLISI